MAERCRQCADPLAEPGVDFQMRLRELGGITYGSGKEYCINCWLEWFGGRHHHIQVVTLEVANEQSGGLSASCRALSGATILTKHRLSTATTLGDITKWLEEGTSQLRRDRDARFYTMNEYIDYWTTHARHQNSSDDQSKLLSQQWLQCPPLKKGFKLTLPNARLLPEGSESERLTKIMCEDAILVKDRVVYVGEPKKLSGGLVLEKGARGFVCDAKDDEFRVRFKELHSGTERCSSIELKREAMSVSRELAGDSQIALPSAAVELVCRAPGSIFACAAPEAGGDSTDLSAAAIQESERQARQEENSNLAKAIVLSKADIHAWPEAVVLRLLKYSDEIRDALMTAASLEQIRLEMKQSGQDLNPSWANGAWVFVPRLHAELILNPEYRLESFFVIIQKCDIGKLKCALKGVRKPIRPKFREVPQHESCDGAESDHEDYEVLRTFVHVPDAQSLHSSARAAKSSPP